MEISIEELKIFLSHKTSNQISEKIKNAVGKNLFIRTVTHHYTGHCISGDNLFLTIEKAAWIADDGRFADALLSGNFDEVEMYPVVYPVNIGVGTILDFTQIDTIPMVTK